MACRCEASRGNARCRAPLRAAANVRVGCAQEKSMTRPSATDAKNLVSSPTPKLPHERDESSDGPSNPDVPEIQQAFDSTAAAPQQSDTSKSEATDKTYNDSVVEPQERQSGTAPGRTEPDPAAQK
jgi:hypothetical protein